MAGEPTHDVFNEPIATLAITVDPKTGEPGFEVSLHSEDTLTLGEAAELRHALCRFEAIAGHVQEQWDASHPVEVAAR